MNAQPFRIYADSGSLPDEFLYAVRHSNWNYAATHTHTWKDSTAIFLSLIAVSMPSFWFALLLIRFFGVTLRWLPISGVESWTGWILPCAAMALGLMALIARQMRSDVLEVLRQVITKRVPKASAKDVRLPQP